MLQRHVSHSRVLLLKSTVPIIATRSRTETISNGSRYCEKSSSPNGCVPPATAGIGGGRRNFPPRETRAKEGGNSNTRIKPGKGGKFRDCPPPAPFNRRGLMAERESNHHPPAE